jgi:hypothetical protein
MGSSPSCVVNVRSRLRLSAAKGHNWRVLAPAINLIRQAVVDVLDVAQDPQCVIDSLPIPLAACLYTKLTAHTLCVWLNRLLGVPDLLHLKSLAFPTH